MRTAEQFNKKMDDLFYRCPGCWYGSIPRIDKGGSLTSRGNMALSPDRAAHGIAWLAKAFMLEPEVRLGEPEPSGARAILIGFYLRAEDEAKARMIAQKVKDAQPVPVVHCTPEVALAFGLDKLPAFLVRIEEAPAE